MTNDRDPESSGKNFRLKFGERAITEAVDILTRNLSRALDDEGEEDEKLALSLSVLHFLKFTSVNNDLKRYLENTYESFKSLMVYESTCTSANYLKFPIEVEMTNMGKTIDIL